MVDGGYIDNSGVEAALDLVRVLKTQASADPDPKQKRFRLILISLTSGGYSERSSYSFGELLEPVRALLSTRQTRAFMVVDRARHEMSFRTFATFPDLPPGEVIKLPDLHVIALKDNFYNLPIGWTISNISREIIEKQSGNYRDCQPDANFQQTLPYLSNSDCALYLIKNELNGSLVKASRMAAISNAKINKINEPPPAQSRMDYDQLLRCVSDHSARPMRLVEYEEAMALFKAWDERPDLTDFRVLAYVFATAQFETAGRDFLKNRGPPNCWRRKIQVRVLVISSKVMGIAIADVVSFSLREGITIDDMQTRSG